MNKKKILPFAIALVVIAIVVLVVGKKQGWFGKEFTISVATEKVESKTLTEFITANGKIQPETQVKISPDVSGEVIQHRARTVDGRFTVNNPVFAPYGFG